MAECDWVWYREGKLLVVSLSLCLVLAIIRHKADISFSQLISVTFSNENSPNLNELIPIFLTWILLPVPLLGQHLQLSLWLNQSREPRNISEDSIRNLLSFIITENHSVQFKITPRLVLKSRPSPHFDPNHSLCLCLEFVPASILSIFQSEIVILSIVKLRDRGCDQFGCLGQTVGDTLPLKTPTPGNKNHRKNNKISGK